MSLTDIQQIQAWSDSLDGPRGVAYQGSALIPPGESSDTTELEDGRAVVVLVMSPEAAGELAANRLARLPSDLLADQAKPIAHIVADALIAAGYGS